MPVLTERTKHTWHSQQSLKHKANSGLKLAEVFFFLNIQFWKCVAELCAPVLLARMQSLSGHVCTCRFPQIPSIIIRTAWVSWSKPTLGIRLKQNKWDFLFWPLDGTVAPCQFVFKASRFLQGSRAAALRHHQRARITCAVIGFNPELDNKSHA